MVRGTHIFFRKPPCALPLGGKRERQPKGASCGYTMLELVIVIALVAVLSLVLGRLLLSGVDAFHYTTNRKEALRQARIALNAISRELRQIRDSQSIVLAGRYAISFVTVEGEDVSLTTGEGTVLRNGVAVARNVSEFELHYYTQDGKELATPVVDRTQIRAIRVVIGVDVGGKEIQLNTEVRPRNL
ncbi:MAG: prepilin-type N-terminal cleavage/methylation domain-containing protein [candidate division KSB1 bacterium]|nr:prepilin-type N-terminal cleavage/methylation domain-containing protein [candidate division KSB1 bacterium]